MIPFRSLRVLAFMVTATGLIGCQKARTPTATSAMLPVGDVQIHYEIHGAGTPVFLLHGGSADAGSWANQVPTLSARYRVIALDSRGHGRSTYSERPLSYALMASDVLAVMDSLGIRQAHVVGWSDGANIGLELAMHHPERLLKVIAYGANFDPSGIRADAMENEKLTQFLAAAAANYRTVSPAPARWDALLANLGTMWESQPRFTAEQLGRIAIPILVLDGEMEEAIDTAHTRELARRIPTASLTLMPGTGHFAPWEQPARFNAIVIGFLDQ